MWARPPRRPAPTRDHALPSLSAPGRLLGRSLGARWFVGVALVSATMATGCDTAVDIAAPSVPPPSYIYVPPDCSGGQSSNPSQDRYPWSRYLSQEQCDTVALVLTYMQLATGACGTAYGDIQWKYENSLVRYDTTWPDWSYSYPDEGWPYIFLGPRNFTEYTADSDVAKSLWHEQAHLDNPSWSDSQAETFASNCASSIWGS